MIGGDERIVPYDAVDSGDVPVHILYRKIQDAKEIQLKELYANELKGLLAGREFLLHHFNGYLNVIRHLVGDGVNGFMNDRTQTLDEDLERFCYRSLVDKFNKRCLNLNEVLIIFLVMKILSTKMSLLIRTAPLRLEKTPRLCQCLQNSVQRL